MAQNRPARSVEAKTRSKKLDFGAILTRQASEARSSQPRNRVPGSSTEGGGLRPPILNKRQASELFGSGAFGNYVRQWDNVDQVRASGYEGMLVLRTRAAGGGGGPAVYDLSVEDAAKQPFDPAINYFNEQLNDQHKHVTIQGELCRGTRGLEFRYCMLNLPMRPAIEGHSQHTYGVHALFLLQTFCCGRGYDCIMDLLDAYPDHVIEFTVFDIPCGALDWQTIIWEVRRY